MHYFGPMLLYLRGDLIKILPINIAIIICIDTAQVLLTGIDYCGKKKHIPAKMYGPKKAVQLFC